MDLVLSKFKVIQVKRNEFLLKESELCNAVSFVAKDKRILN
jgi:hypothetical protein